MNEAERLAEEIESWNNPCARAASELRRLSAINAELVEALQNIVENGLSTSRIKASKEALEKAKQ